MSTHHDVIVIGGGPAGSSVAAIAARAGLDVLQLEADKHPRVHVGESLLPGIIPILSEMGALEDVESAGFERKSGTTHWNWGKTPEWDLWFEDTDQYDHAWLVDRSKFDEILFRAAGRAGARTEQEAAVREFIWDEERVRGVKWRRRGDDHLHEATATFVIDASGQAALLARALGLRTHIPGLQHQASWAHFEDAGRLPSPRANQALFVAEKGHWIWLFPFGEGRASVGIIRLDDDGSGTAAERAQRFDDTLRASKRHWSILGPNARRVTPVRTQRDWSYRISKVAGPGWMLVGDSSGFIDPVLSTGVFLGMHAGYLAAEAIRSVIQHSADEEEALERYRTKHGEVFQDLLRMVRFYYQQNLYKEDYFWESKRILLNEDTEFKPQKAFLILTSGLVRNLAYDELREEVAEARSTKATGGSELPVATEPLEKLGFICFNLQYRKPDEVAQLYLLIEPTDPAAPTLFRTRNWHVNWLAPRFDNDVIRYPELEPHVRSLTERLRELDSVDDDTLPAFWNRLGSQLVEAVRALPPQFEFVRVFGE